VDQFSKSQLALAKEKEKSILLSALAKARRKNFHSIIWLKPFFLCPSYHELKPVAMDGKNNRQ
jgi:hypothetical protein